MSTLLLENTRISELAELVRQQIPRTANLIVASAAMYVNPDGADRARLNAALATAASSSKADVPHLFMLDSKSPVSVANRLSQAGAIVVPVADDEGGLARPYLTAVRIVEELCDMAVLPSDVLLVKAEAEKNIFGGNDTPQSYFERCDGLDIAIGIRDVETWESMPRFLALTESLLGYSIGQMLGIPDDTPSGVLVLNSAGRQILLETTERNDWTYLIRTPFEGRLRHLKVDDFLISFEYHADVVAEENGNATFDEKRRQQLALMFDYALYLATMARLPVSDELIRMAGRFRQAVEDVRSTNSN